MADKNISKAHKYHSSKTNQTMLFCHQSPNPAPVYMMYSESGIIGHQGFHKKQQYEQILS